jgi:diguanylate cyclase (GGDEF)-like protein
MQKTDQALLPGDPDPALRDWFERVEHFCLILLLLIPAASVTASLLPLTGNWGLSDWHLMKAQAVVATLLCTFSLTFSERDKAKWALRTSELLAAAATALALTTTLAHSSGIIPRFVADFVSAHWLPVRASMELPTAIGFVVLGCALLFTSAENRTALFLGDLFTLCACVTTFTLVSGYVFSKFELFGTVEHTPVSLETLLCLLLLTIATVLRRTQDGILSIFAGSGTGGKLARVLGPILLILPFLREIARARLIGAGRMPAFYLTAMVASLAAIISLALLLYLVWRIHGMESEVHILTLRDELTGLHNLRGFQLLADHALRHAHRAKLPFTVLFIDLDNLKVINDSLGHEAGSKSIVEIADILRNTFRGTEVVGRIGGDEFAVAGQFGRGGIMTAIERLNHSCAKRNQEMPREFPLSFSVGYAVSEDARKVPLRELLAMADEAMYQAKRSKKEARAANAVI